jgi:DHA1 family bicyclomycin/chloramphenicol resistance-like MFS transporter
MAVAVVRDVYEGEEMARAMSFIMAVFVTVPIVAPSLGAAIAVLGPWQIVFWFCAVYALVVGVWSVRLNETLAPENRRELRMGRVLDAAREVLTQRQTMSYTLSMVFLFGAFSSYLASSELIVGEIYGRPGLFPFIFGGVAIGMGSAMLANAKIVGQFGLEKTVRYAVGAYMILAIGLLVVVAMTDGRPPFWVTVVWVSAILVMYATMIPNVNSAAIAPMGHIAGMASAVIGTISLAGGAVLGTIIDRQISGTITPLVAGMVIYGAMAAGWILWAERRPVAVSSASQDAINQR